MVSCGKALHLVLAIGITGLAAPVMAARQPVTDAEGRVFGDTINDPLPEWKQPPGPQVQPQLPPIPASYGTNPVDQPDMDRMGWDQERAAWLSECRQRFGGRGKTAGGVIGGLIGGVAGSAIAGRGQRALGAVVGGVAGAVTGAAIGNSSDRRNARDYCESYLDRYMANYHQSYYPAYANRGYAYSQGIFPQGPVAYTYAVQPTIVMVPVVLTTVATQIAPQQECTEVVEEWVPVTQPARRYIPRRIIPDKRVRVYPDKRVRAY